MCVKLSQSEVLRRVQAARPDLRCAASECGRYIGAWDEALGRYRIVASQILGGAWASVGQEVCGNGVRMGSEATWSK